MPHATPPPPPAQVHSFNDLREWPQLFAKAATLSPDAIFAKVDPQYAPPDLCAAQQRVVNKTDPRGCLLLNHDTIDSGSRSTFNTTGDLLALLGDDASPLAPYLRDPARPVHISLCFKGCGALLCPCIGADAWLSLVDDLFAAANAVVQQVSGGGGSPARAHACGPAALAVAAVAVC
jgi:hypothetical protein